MSDKKQDKWLYTFTTQREVDVEKVTDEVINGENVKITKKIKEKKPITFALKSPNRRMFEKADLFYGVQLSEGIRAGLLTKALLLKRYRNDGGALSDADTEYFNELTTKYGTLEDEHQRLIINVDNKDEKEKTEKINNIIEQKREVLQGLQAIESVNQALFAHTAESKAQGQLNNWWIVHLAYWDENNSGGFTELFPGETFEKKMERWDVFDEDRQPFMIEALARFSLLIGLWNAGAKTKEDFEQGEKDYGSIAQDIVEEIQEKKEVPVDAQQPPETKA